ncbi:MAG: deoxyribodipyrimidine photo-lyase [Candidatus Krumholzibacteriia bacterium]
MSDSGRVQPERVRALRKGPPSAGPVIYWMRRDQRVRDNWALVHAQDLARHLAQPLLVVFNLVPEFLGAARRQFAFMLAGLGAVHEDLARLGIPFFLVSGEPEQTVVALAGQVGAGAVVTDFNPLRISRQWEQAVAARLTVPLHIVDAHNVVPVWRVSDKQEYAARTIRPKLQRLLPTFLTEIPAVVEHPHRWTGTAPRPDVRAALADHAAAAAGPDIGWCEPGEAAAHAALARFVGRRLGAYDTARNDPTVDGQSDLSPYFHFGQLAPQRAALVVSRQGGDGPAAYLEELVVRRELSDNFCHHNRDYDRYEGLPAWARRTLEDHLDDPREHLYELEAFAAGATHDPLWNAAQTELVVRGKLHGYLRMYWAKKILEWTRDPGEALDVAITLNDRYSLDGRDPNGYVGCAWSVGGLHDRPWTERPVFGKVRYMNFNGCKRKFKVDRYIDAMARLRREVQG